jgi:hypothetical protein
VTENKINGNETPLESWIVGARPGARFIYFTSGPNRSISDLEHTAIRKAAMRLSDEGRVFLLQRKLATDVYEYRAVVRSPRPEKLEFPLPKMAGVKWR